MRWLDHLNAPPAPAFVPDLNRWDQHDLAALWIGHATTLLRLSGLTFLTDPVFSNRVGIGLGLMTGGPRRLVAPALAIRQLPKVDVLLLSHAHFDHLDRPTLSKLPKKMHVVASNGLRDLVDDLGFERITELKWGESVRVGDVNITAQPVKHWGARTFYDTHRGYGAFLLETTKQRVLYGADTAYQEEWKSIGKVDLAIVGIGAYNPYIQAHANPEQALQMADHVRAEHIMPMHHSTFKLSHEPTNEPIERMLDAAGPNFERIIARQVGEVWVPN